MSKRKYLTEPEVIALMDELQAIYNCIDTLPNILGPAFGAAWCDKALRLEHKLHDLSLDIEDKTLTHLPLPGRAQVMPLKDVRDARMELAGFDLGLVATRRTVPLTAPEHDALGLRLREAKTRLEIILDRLAAQCGLMDRGTKSARKALRVLNNMCVELEEKARRQVGGERRHYGNVENLKPSTGLKAARDKLAENEPRISRYISRGMPAYLPPVSEKLSPG